MPLLLITLFITNTVNLSFCLCISRSFYTNYYSLCVPRSFYTNYYSLCIPRSYVYRRYLKRKPLQHHGLWLVGLAAYSHLVHTSMTVLNCPSIISANGDLTPVSLLIAAIVGIVYMYTVEPLYKDTPELRTPL